MSTIICKKITLKTKPMLTVLCSPKMMFRGLLPNPVFLSCLPEPVYTPSSLPPSSETPEGP